MSSARAAAVALLWLGIGCGTPAVEPSPGRMAQPADETISEETGAIPLSVLLDAVVPIEGSETRGTGFFLAPDGLLVTNATFVGADATVKIALRSGETGAARVLARHSDPDLAFLTTAVRPLTLLTLADPDDFEIGAEVFALGAPAEGRTAVTRGIVSAVWKNPDGVWVVQTDASIRPGFGGGPLVASDSGRVLGVNWFRSRAGSEGIHFAISSREIASRRPRTID